LSPNPILKVLSTFQKHQVRALLIGGQAAILYGAAEFSRDSDFVVLVTGENLRRLRCALAELEAESVFLPPLAGGHLRRGHAVHFRCRAAEARGLRIDLLARLRGCSAFAALWRRRAEVRLPSGEMLPVIGLRDLVQSKKTQRDKDWFMLRRLVENDIRRHRRRPAAGQASWWLRECRDPALLIELALEHPRAARSAARARPLLEDALAGDAAGVAAALADEERRERDADREYWKPLREELARMRRARPFG